MNTWMKFGLVVAGLMFCSVVRADSAAKMEELKAAVKASDKLEDKVKTFVVDKLIPVCANAKLAAETAAQNAKGMTLEEIQKIDKEWQGAVEVTPIQKEKTTNACAVELKDIASKATVLSEVFVMDNQGGIVGETEVTSDYWQGDEAKWRNSYADGKGGVDVGKVSFDVSAGMQLQQVSLPILDASGAVIGAVTFGIDISKL